MSMILKEIFMISITKYGTRKINILFQLKMIYLMPEIKNYSYAPIFLEPGQYEILIEVKEM